MNAKSPTTQAVRFPLGQIVSTPGALDLMERYHVNPLLLLGRHLAGDWGDVCQDDAQANQDALENGARLFSVYQLPSPVGMEDALAPAKVWIITEADRSTTTLLLPEEY